MSRLSAGKSKGTTDRKTSRRLMGGGGGGSAATSLAVGKIETPSLVPQAAPVDSYIQTNVPDAPAPTKLFTPPPLPGADPNLERLANELGAFNKNLLPTVGAIAKGDYLAEQNAKAEAAAIIGQEEPGIHPEKAIAQISQRLHADKNNTSFSTEERMGAEKLLNRITNSGRLQRQIESQSKIRLVREGALTLATKAQGATIETKDDNNKPIVIRLESLRSDDPLYQKWVTDNIYGNQYLDPDEYKSLQPIITNAIAQDITRQDKANKNYELEEYQTNLRTDTTALGRNLAVGGSGVVTDVTQGLQIHLNKMRTMIPWVSKEDQAKLRAQIPTLLVQSFIANNTTQSEELVSEVLRGLAIGPEESRYITKTEIIDGEKVTTKTLNPKQSWVESLGGENWLMITLSDAKYQLSEADRKGDLATTHFGSEAMEARINKEVAPLMSGPNKDLVAAKKKLQDIKTEYLTQTTGTVSSEVQGIVLKDADQIFTNLQRVDSFTITDDILAASKLVAGAKVSVQKNAQLEEALIQLEKKYPGNKQVTEFITETRAKTSVYETSEFKQYYKGVTSRITKIKERWDKYAKLADSFNGNDTAIEDGKFTTARVKLDELGTEIILRNLKNGTPQNIEKELATALTRANVGLLQENEEPWTPSRGSHFEGNADTALDAITTSYEFLPGGLKPADRRKLTLLVRNYKPIFSPQVTMEMATLARQGKLDPRLRRMLKELGIKPGDFFIQQFSKFQGHIRLSEENKKKLLELNGIKL